MKESQPIQRRVRLAGPGHRTLTAVLAGCAALSGIRGTAFAQTDGDDSNTIWSATMIVGDTTWTIGALTVDQRGFSEGSFGSLSPTTFSYGNTDYAVEEIRTRQLILDGSVINSALYFALDTGVFPAASEDRLVLVLDGTRFQLSERPTYHTNYYGFKDPGLSWSGGDTVDVKLIDAAPPPLTASFTGMPDSHADAAFTFWLEFSEEVENLSSVTLMGAFDVTGGSVQKVRPGPRGGSKTWHITLDPNSASDTVTVALPETTDCSAAGAICTADQRPLSHALSDTVAGPAVVPSVSVSDASAAEGETVRFTLSLSEATDEQVSVRYATSGGTATGGGIDFTTRVGKLIFAANQTSREVTVWTTEDTLDEEDETFTLTLSNPTASTLGDATATGTIIDDDDPPPLTVSVSDASATEGEAVEFTVSLSHAATQQVTVGYATSGGTATAGDDFTAESSTLAFAANETSKTVAVATTEDTVDEGDETFTLTLSSPTNATLGDATATGTIIDDDAAPAALTATFGGMPDDHSGAAFTFALTFSEEIEGLSYLTLRDSAFVVSGGGVRRARRKVQGENKAWTITVRPDAATDTVAITLPATTDCQAGGAICTSDNRKLSAAVSDTVLPASSAGDMAGGGAEEDALAILDGLSPGEASEALFGERELSEAQIGALDRLGNRNGSYDLGDMLAWTERCRSGEARCGSDPAGTGAAASGLLLFGAAAAGRRRRSRRTGRRGSGRRSERRTGTGLALLLAAATAWSCTADLAGPPAAGRDDPGVPPAPAAIPRGPGFLTVEWTAPAAGRGAGVLLELEGPGITAVEAAPGLELYRSAAPGRHRIVVAGTLGPGPLLLFRVPDRGRLSLYRVRILQVTGEDYGLRDPREYRAVISPP